MAANLAELFETVAGTAPDADAIVVDGDRFTYGEVDERCNRLANALADRGVGPGDRIGVLLGNTHEHLEVLLACFKLRALAVNLNIRFVASELLDVVTHSGATVVVHEPDLAHLLPDGVDGIARGVAYERLLAEAAPSPPTIAGRSGDDHYVLYTGGTTGRPRGVIWRHADLHVAALAGHIDLGARRVLVACPFFHGTGQWMALATLLTGGTVVTTSQRSIDASALWDLAERERASYLVIVGDAYARPLVEALEASPEHWRSSELTVVLSGGATLSPEVTARLVDALPDVMVVDGYGATETGGQARLIAVAGAVPGVNAELSGFLVGDDTAILDDDLRPRPRGDRTEGWLARRGALPIGYDGDDDASAQTFPEVDGVRWAIPGDRARWAGPDRVEIIGRGVLTINTGGEKVHPEEVEAVLRTHEDVADAVVVGIADERWGEVVTAVVAAAGGRPPTLDELDAHCRSRLAGFKVPRRLVVVDRVRRSSSGKPDYQWARATAG